LFLIPTTPEHQGEQEYLIEEIFYPIDDADIERSVRQVLVELLIEIKESPETFAELASQFSKAPNGGQIGWVLLETLPTEIRNVVKTMEKEGVSPIIRTLHGLSLVKLVDRRTVDNDMNKITKESIEYRLTMEKVDILAKRKLRDLKDSAFIEVKLK